MRRIPVLLALAVLMAGAAFAGPVKHADWAEGPLKHMMTSEEIEHWKTISTDAEAEAFIALFWARRDPTPATPENEMRVEFEKRVALADQHFTTKRTRGALTDRGRTLILLGSPWQVGGKGGAAKSQRAPSISTVDNWDGSVLGTRGESAKLTWTYAYEKKPKFIRQKDLEIMFADEQGDGQWEFVKTGKMNPEAVMQQAIASLIFSPDLTAAPVFATAAPPAQAATFRTLALKDACDQFRAEGKASEGPALLTWGQFVTPEGEVFVPVQVFVPGGKGIEAGRKLTLFGVVENEAGEVVEVHEETVTLIPSRRDAYVDKSLLLKPGSYKATFGLAEEGKILSMARTEMKVDALDPAESAISEMILSNNAYPLGQAQDIRDPFAFGGFKVVPKADGLFSTQDDINFFYELRNPGVTEAGAPKIQVKIDIEGKTVEDKPVKMNFPMQEFPAVALPGVKNHFGLPLTFPLADFKPGKYTVKIKVIDTVLKKSYQSEKQFEIRG